ncbi:hypothetical protein L7F22_035164 [Adiantum nelumboides]|nr:hypothetical protein [Adiantum nelumboides]
MGPRFTKEIVNEALQLQLGTYDLIPKTKAIDNEKAFLKVKGSKFKYSNLIYSELPLRLISQYFRVQKPPKYTEPLLYFRVQKPPKYTEPLLHMAVVMALCVAERRQVRCDYAKFILETLIEAILKNSAKKKLYMSAGPRVTYQALGMIEDLPAASSQAALIQQAKYVPKAVKTTTSAASSRTTRSRKGSSDDERTDIDKDQDLDESDHEDIPNEAEAKGPSEYERSDEEDTSTPLEKKSKKPRSREQVLMDEAMARVEARRKQLVDARAAKAAKTAKPTTMEEARKQRLEKAKALQKERKRLEAEEKAQEEAEAAQAAQTQDKEDCRPKDCASALSHVCGSHLVTDQVCKEAAFTPCAVSTSFQHIDVLSACNEAMAVAHFGLLKVFMFFLGYFTISVRKTIPGGIFSLRLIFGENYPEKPPRVRFTSEVYHPNVYSDGTLCMDIIQDAWSPCHNVSTILTSIQSLLTDPNPASPANPDAAHLCQTDIKAYNRKVRQCVRKSLDS